MRSGKRQGLTSLNDPISRLFPLPNTFGRPWRVNVFELPILVDTYMPLTQKGCKASVPPLSNDHAPLNRFLFRLVSMMVPGWKRLALSHRQFMVACITTVDSGPRCWHVRADEPIKCWVLGNVESIGILVERHRLSTLAGFYNSVSRNRTPVTAKRKRAGNGEFAAARRSRIPAPPARSAFHVQ